MSKTYCNFVLDLLNDLGSVRARAMFGGYGIYLGDTIFGLIADDVLYFKVNASNRPDYESAGSRAFSYEAKGNKKVAMSYWEVPLEILENPEDLITWAKKSCAVSRQQKKVIKNSTKRFVKIHKEVWGQDKEKMNGGKKI